MPDHIRIEHAPTPEAATEAAFGRGLRGFQVKDLGTQVSVIRSDMKRKALLQSPDGWTTFGSKS